MHITLLLFFLLNSKSVVFKFYINFTNSFLLDPIFHFISVIFLLNSMYVLLHFYSWQFSLHLISYSYSSHSTFKNCTVYCMDLLSFFLPNWKALYIIPIPICPTFPLYSVPCFIFHFYACHFFYVSFLHLDPIYLIYLHVTVLILLSYFLNSFRSVQDTSHIHSKFITLYLISANSISCIPSRYSSVFFISFLYIIFLLLIFQILLLHYFISVHGISLTFPSIFSLHYFISTYCSSLYFSLLIPHLVYPLFVHVIYFVFLFSSMFTSVLCILDISLMFTSKLSLFFSCLQFCVFFISNFTYAVCHFLYFSLYLPYSIFVHATPCSVNVLKLPFLL